MGDQSRGPPHGPQWMGVWNMWGYGQISDHLRSEDNIGSYFTELLQNFNKLIYINSSVWYIATSIHVSVITFSIDFSVLFLF